MKSKLFLLLLFISILFSSCTLDGESNYTPQIVLLKNPFLQNGDSLNLYFTDEGGVFRLDTISVGDTVTFLPYMTGFENNLTAFYLKQTSDSIAKIILPDKTAMDSIFLPTSDYKNGNFYMKGTSTALLFPFKYVAKSPSNDAKIQLAVVSDANFKNLYGSNNTTITIKTPIIKKK
ncbi:MAG: hypothetical protein Q7U47_09580 [Paludibacter sp.]|nr:hypothetical protein [Paludibacter sp.]